MSSDEPLQSSLYLSPLPRYEGETDSERSASPEPDSPSASTFLRTAATLDGLARQLGDLSATHSREPSLEDEQVGKCCCGASTGTRACTTIIERDKMEERMKLSGEIGQALLARYEALEKKFRKEVERSEHQLLVKRKALEDSVKRVRNLERANTQHLQQYAEMSRKQEALEKRYTHSLHTQTLTQQSLTHVRAELQALRENTTRQNISAASGTSLQDQVLDAERRYEDAKDALELEKRNTRDETRKRKRAEARVVELEEKVKEAEKEIEETKKARAKDAQDLLANARERLEILHTELSETFRADIPNETPQYQKALEDLVATNTLLKHDTSELSAMLAESREETRLLREEVEEYRAAPHLRPISPNGVRPLTLSAELSQLRTSGIHSRTESSPMVGTYVDRLGWSRMSTSSSTGPWDHQRKSSLAPSLSSSAAGEGPYSPGLGMGQVGEYAGAVQREEGTLSPTIPSGRESPRPMFRASPSGGLGYVVNGIPKKSQRPGLQRSYSVDKRRSYFGTDTIVEDPTNMESQDVNTRPRSPASPGTAYFAAAEASRKRRSLVMARRQTMSPHESSAESPLGFGNGMIDSASGSQSITDFPSPLSESALTSPQKSIPVQRKTLLLLSRSRGVQTDTDELVGDLSRSQPCAACARRDMETPPVQPSDMQSETSSIHESVKGNATISLLIDHLGKVLNRLRSADIPTLNKRLKKHNLPGDVGHLSRSTMRALEAEVSDLRNHFRSLGGDNAILTRKEFTMLIKLLKEVFADLVELQGVVNDVTVDPSLAKKLQKRAFRDEEEEAARAKQGTGLGWIAAPITKFFVTPATEVEVTSTESPSRSGRTMDRGRLQPGNMKASKQMASTSATTTHVSVEFGGTGIVRKATHAGPSTTTNVEERLPPSPREVLEDGSTMQAQQARGLGAQATLRVPGTIKRSKSRANRNELLGIFAGAQRPVSPAGGPWHVVAGEPGSGNQPSASGSNANINTNAFNTKTIRAVSSTYFDKTIKGRSPDARKRLPMAVYAVIDSSADQLQGADPSCIDEPIQPALLERQLRPRGLSDSSIRSTYHAHANPSHDLVTTARISSGPAPRQVAYGTTTSSRPKTSGGGGIFESLSNRLYSFRANTEVSPVNPPKEPEIEVASTQSTPSLEIPEVKILPSTPMPTSSKPIAVSPSSSAQRSISPPTTTTQASSQTGLFGILASSIKGDGLDDTEDLGARYKRSVVVPRSLSASRGGRSWE